MKIEYDKIADALYIRLSRGRVSETKKLKDRLIVDIDRAGKVLGIEILGASSQLSSRNLSSLKMGTLVTL